MESVRDIVREMRGSTKQEYCSSKHCCVKVYNPILDFADRIEEAWNREKKTLRNCDRFATGEAERAFSEFEAFCDAHECDKCPAGKIDGRYGACIVAWMLAPYDEDVE